MPPKVKITKDEILKAALGIVRKGGAQALNARALADALGCSTQPVFSNYPGMDELRADVDRAAYELYREYLASGAKRSDVPKYKAFGLAYIEFAKEEPELFRLLFMCDRSGGKKEEAQKPSTGWRTSYRPLSEFRAKKHMSFTLKCGFTFTESPL